MEKKIKLLHIISSLNYGGVETMLYRFIIGTKNRFDNVIVTLNERGKLAHKIEEKGIVIYNLQKKGKWDLSAIFKLRNIIKKENPQIIQSYAFTGNIWSRLSLLFKNKKVFTYERGTAAANNNFFNILDKMLSFKDKIRICNSNTSKILTEKRVGIKKTVIIDNFIDLNTPLGKKHEEYRDKFVIGYIGRLEWKRGAFLLPDIAKELKKKIDDFVFLVLGEGNLRKEIEIKIGDYKLEKYFTIKGFINNPFNYYNDFDIGLFTNLTESFGNSALELLSRGVPIIAPYCDNYIDIVKHNENGLLYEKKHSSKYKFYNIIDDTVVRGKEGDPMEITEKIVKMKNSLPKFVETSNQLKGRYNKFSEENYIRHLLELYKK